VTAIFFDGEGPQNMQETQSPILLMAATQLKEYFDGDRKTFDVPISPAGGPFHKKVWRIMIDEIKYGQVTSYSELAQMAGNPKAARAVGMANNRNPIPIIIPCHRVLGKSGKLTGFRAGLSIKEKLLTLEGIG